MVIRSMHEISRKDRIPNADRFDGKISKVLQTTLLMRNTPNTMSKKSANAAARFHSVTTLRHRSYGMERPLYCATHADDGAKGLNLAN